MRINGISKEEHKRKAALLAAFLLAASIIYLLAGLFFDFFIPCPFRMFTGLKCPGCGLSHAVCDLARFHLAAAFTDNALFIPIFTYIIYVAYRSFNILLPGHKEKDSLSDTFAERIDILFLILVLVWWVVRNILGI